MKALTDGEIRNSFVNCSKGEAKRLPIPRDLADRPWDDLDFFGWHDPRAPERGYLVAERDGRLVGVALRRAEAPKGSARHNLCSLCLTSHTGGGVTLMTARKTGAEGRLGNSVGEYMCADLACSLYVRGKKKTATATRIREGLSEAEQIARMVAKLGAYLDRLDG